MTDLLIIMISWSLAFVTFVVLSRTGFSRSLMATRSVFSVRSQKQSNVGRSSKGKPKIYYLELLNDSEGTLESLTPTGPCVVGYGQFSLCVIH
jgi:hypothetical protein